MKYICPNATVVEISDEFYASVVPCADRPQAVYAKNVECAEGTYTDGLWISFMLV